VVVRRLSRCGTFRDRFHIGSDSQEDVHPVSGRKHTEESRAPEFRERLSAWRQTPASARPSLRALARELGTSHQLLMHYLRGLEKWRYKQCYRKATEEADQILARAIVEDRPMTQCEQQQRHAFTLAAVRAQGAAILLDELTKFKQEAKRGPLHPAQFKTVKNLAKHGFPGARELLQKCLRDGVKETKPFAEIVKETPRQEGETSSAWVRRIWNQCSKYDTKCPAVITEKLLEKYAQCSANNRSNNLPALSAHAAKSFRTGVGTGNGAWQLR
jgi:hypothetical protein